MSDLKNICVVTCWFPTKNSNMGVFVQEISSAIHKHHVANVSIYHIHIHRGNKAFGITKTSRVVEGMEVSTFEIEGLFYKAFYLLPWLVYRMVRKDFNRRIIREKKPDYLHAHVIHPAGIITHHLARTFQLPYFITEHWSRLDKYFGRTWFRSTAKKAYLHAKKVILVSRYLEDKVKQYIPLTNTIVIPNVVSDEFYPTSEKPPGKDGRIRCLCVAAWKYPKRPDLIFQALENLSKEYKITLQVVGTGPELEKLSTEWSFDVEWLGIKNKGEIADLMRSSDFLLHASEFETFSLVVAESIACGTPVIASNAGAIPNLVSSNVGILTENDLAAWTKNVKLGFDTMLSVNTSVNAQNYFSSANVAKAYEKLFL